jgi:hypothetical protein
MSSWNNTSLYGHTTWNYRKVERNNFNRYSAGILPYTFDQQGTCLFLLGKDNDNDWSDFGGRCEFKDKNDEKNTAIREFYEETLGSVINITECLDKVINGVKIISKTLNGSPYYMFLVYVEYSNYSDSFNKTSNFLKYHYSQNYSDRNSIQKIIEKSSIRWFTLDTLINCIENKGNLISLRGVFYKTIESCKDQLVLLSK